MITQPLRDEHQELLPELDHFVEAAESITAESPEEVRRRIDAVVEFLRHHLIPHAQTEDQVLYPEVERLLGATGSTATMKRDHAEVGAMTEELESVASALADGAASEALVSAQRLLYGLYAVVRLHFAKEEEVFLPLLDERLTEAEGSALFRKMEQVAAGIKAR